jgi:hypothetical protein
LLQITFCYPFFFFAKTWFLFFAQGNKENKFNKLLHPEEKKLFRESWNPGRKILVPEKKQQ